MTIEELAAIVAINARAIEALGEKVDQGFGNTLETLNQENQLISELRETQQENAVIIAQATGVVVENNRQIDVLIAESRENNRQHAEFRQRIEALTETLQSLLTQVLTRVNQIWDRMAS